MLWERHQARSGRLPLINGSLFRFGSYARGTALAGVYFAGFTPLFFVLTVYLQSGVGYDPLLAGLSSTPFATASAVGAVAGGRLVRR